MSLLLKIKEIEGPQKRKKEIRRSLTESYLVLPYLLSRPVSLEKFLNHVRRISSSAFYK
jgi:hypothetical protein